MLEESTVDDAIEPGPLAGSDLASDSQAAISAEIMEIRRQYSEAATEETQPRLDYPPYRSTILRHPTKDLHHIDPETIELTAPAFGPTRRRRARGRPHHSGQRRSDRPID
jgi:protocatechuate 3,4-dioxygenase beta subunit